MRSSLNRPRAYFFAVVFALTVTGCSTGDLSRSEAKKKISKTIDICDPCFVKTSPTEALGAKLIQVGYVDRSSLQLTPSGQQEIGSTAYLKAPRYNSVFFVGAFRKEVDEITGISIDPQGIAKVEFTYKIMPRLSIIRDSPLETFVTRLEIDDLKNIATIEQDGGKLVALHASGSARLKKYDDGWRIERANIYSPKLYLHMPSIGGVANAALNQ